MIQRKQTLFLLLAAVLMAVCFMFPVASFKAVAPLGVPVSGSLTLVAKDVPETMSQILNGEPVVTLALLLVVIEHLQREEVVRGGTDVSI